MNQNIIDLGRACRLCGKTSICMYKIYEGEGLLLNLESKINSHLAIKVTKNDLLPLNVCIICANMLGSWYWFGLECLKVDQNFKENCSSSEIICKTETNTTKSDPIDPDKNHDKISLKVIEPEANYSKPQTVRLEKPLISHPTICTIVHTTCPISEEESQLMPLNDLPAIKAKPKTKITHLMPECKHKCRQKFSPYLQNVIYERIRKLQTMEERATLLSSCIQIQIGSPDRFYIQRHIGYNKKIEVCRLCFLWSLGKSKLITNKVFNETPSLPVTNDTIETRQPSEQPILSDRPINIVTDETPLIGNIKISRRDTNEKRKLRQITSMVMPECQYKCRLKFTLKSQTNVLQRIPLLKRDSIALARLFSYCWKIGKPDRFFIKPYQCDSKVEVCRQCFHWSIGKYKKTD